MQMRSLIKMGATISIGSKVRLTSHTIVLAHKINEFIDKVGDLYSKMNTIFLSVSASFIVDLQ